MINFFKFVYRFFLAWLIHPKVCIGQVWHLIDSDTYCKIMYVNKCRVGYSFYIGIERNIWSTNIYEKSIPGFCWIFELNK